MFNYKSDNICYSTTDLHLTDFICALPHYCFTKHKNSCSKCPPLLQVAKTILDTGYMLLRDAFKSAFPSVTYHSNNAKMKLLRIPLVALRVGEVNSGVSNIYLMEYNKITNYFHVMSILTDMEETKKSSSCVTLSKQKLKDILSMAQSDRERQCIRYTAFVTSGLSATAARKQFGFEKMNDKAQTFEAAIKESKAIHAAFNNVSAVQQKVLLLELGIDLSDDNDTDSSTTQTDDETDDSSYHSSESDIETELSHRSSCSVTDIVDEVRISKFNWFEFVSNVGVTLAEEHFDFICNSLPVVECNLVKQSRDAYLAFEKIDLPDQRRLQAVINGEIVSESESDHPDDYDYASLVGNKEKTKELAKIQLRAIRRRNKRDAVKLISQRRLLSRKVSRRIKGILHDYPNIGKVMEEFVEQRSVGADAWRRTGVLTFDGNKDMKQKVTFKRIQEHLQQVYNRKFSYGTVVQLCIPRNKKRRSASRYKGVAKITCRRARKGFQLKYNPDAHWSAAFYRGLNTLQYTDGEDILNVNRDDASGFRLDTLQTHRLHRSPMVKGKEVLATYTDYVNSYPSHLQTTSYNYTGTKTTNELCAGVVKGAGIFPKNPAQHFADLCMLEMEEVLSLAFLNSAGKSKLIECIRVDGAGDEGPSHLEVQYWWTLHHFKKATFVTMVTARNSGSSHLNRVELQNGCLTLAHSNLFIPSNLNGSCFDAVTGKVDQLKLKANMDVATNIYICRTNGAPCGNTTIQLFRGANSSSFQDKRKEILVFLRGSKLQKLKLEKEKPELWQSIKEVWDVRERHHVQGVPTQYVFFLKCCLMDECPHPICQQKNMQLPTVWFRGGPSLDYIPYPIPDPCYPWGNSQCPKCSSEKLRVCYGHFLPPEDAFKSTINCIKEPPSRVLKEWFDTFNREHRKPSKREIEEIAKLTLLPPEEVNIWFQHLSTVQVNRKRGAKKAAETRAHTKAQRSTNESSKSKDVCVCGTKYADVTDEVENWIACDNCDSWNHCRCVEIDPDNLPQCFNCLRCSKK